MSVTASPALITASCAAATNERPAGYRRNSDVWDKNTRRGGSLGITHSIPALTQRENTNSLADVPRTAPPKPYAGLGSQVDRQALREDSEKTYARQHPRWSCGQSRVNRAYRST